MDPLADVAELRAWLQDPNFDGGTAAVVLAAASGTVRGQTGQDFSLVTGDTVVLDGSEDDWLYLPQRPVTAVSAVDINGAALPVGGWTLSGSRIYRYNGWNHAMVLASSNSYGRAPTLITITYDHGYATIPDDVKAATLAVAADIAGNPAGLIAETIDDYTWRRSETPEGTATQMLLAAVVRRYGVGARSVRLHR
jgi:hypothetical protein